MNTKAKSMIQLKWFVLVTTLTLVFSCQTKIKEQKLEDKTISTVKVAVEKVTTSKSSSQLNYSGNVIPKITTPLSFLLPGTVITVKVDEGDWVTKGQVLAQLNTTSYKSAYRGTLATLKQAQDAYNRLKAVRDKGSLPEIRWQDVTAKLAQAKSANQIALQNLENSILKAPSNGYIGMRNVEIGETSVPGVPVFNLINIHEVYVKVAVPENEINKIKKEQTASVSIPALGSQIFTGKIEKIGVVANSISKTYDVKINLQNQQKIIKPGMACDIVIHTNTTHNITAIPHQSVSKDNNGQYYVYIVNPKSKIAFKKQVKLGAFTNNKIEILSGINVGDIVVTEGMQKLSNNTKVVY